MNLSNFKLGIYDLLGLVIRGMILVCEGSDTLLATADLSRSFLVLVVLAAPAAVRIAWDMTHRLLVFLPLLLGFLALLTFVGFLASRRMDRFRRMSETGVFRAYLGSRPAAN